MPDTASLVSTDQATRQAFRQQLRLRRQALSQQEQKQASEQVSERLLNYIVANSHQRIALFFANDGEINLAPLVDALWQQQRQTAAPILHPVCAGHLLFLAYHANSLMHENRFGIPEPVLRCDQVMPLSQLDLILTPLVGFDAAGNRLGMGGGFYDRTLSGWAHGRYPKLHVAGVAHDCQFVDALPHAAWDVPLPTIITPSKTWSF
ncbi:MAG: 5-formyltetrahydrofolate cyclo-ligase [Gammaproteobacteria bacterium]|nr:5-formyltetrahydrofolate cyclo-ligase [Gammaproteobacteria bacterium]